MVYPDTLNSLQIPLSLPLTSSYNNLEDDYSICAFSKIHGQNLFIFYYKTVHISIYYTYLLYTTRFRMFSLLYGKKMRRNSRRSQLYIKVLNDHPGGYGIYFTSRANKKVK